MARRAAKGSLPNLRSLVCLSLALLASQACAQTRLEDQIAQHERQLAAARQSNDLRTQATELNFLGSLYRQAGNPQKAMEDCNLALGIERLPASQATTKNILGRIYTDLGDESKAQDLYNQALPVFQQAANTKGEVDVLNNIGRSFNNLAQHDKSLDTLNRSLAISRQTGYRLGEATALDSIGRAYLDMGQGPKALEALNQALPIWNEISEGNGQAMTLNNLARVYADMGEKERALDAYQRSLAAWSQIGNREGEARDLHFIGKVYWDLGQDQKALEYLNQALPLWRETRNRNGEALALVDIGRAYADMRELDRALENFNQSLPIWRETQNRRGEAVSLTEIGRTYTALGQPERALDFDYESLAAWRQAQDRRGESYALNSIGRAYSGMGQPQRAVPVKLAALSLAKSAADPELEGGIETSLMVDFIAQNRREEAILFGTQAVNAYQQIRHNITGLDADIQTGFAESKSATYRMLAELLVQDDRLGEAEHVMDLLKEEELKEVVRGAPDTAAAKLQPVALTQDQQKAAEQLSSEEDKAMALTDLSAEYATLSAKPTRTADEAARLKDLEAKVEAGNSEVSDFFRKTLYPDLAQKAGAEDANALLSREKSQVSQLQNTLARLGPQAMGIRLLLGENHAYAIVVTAQARKKFELPATSAALRSKVLEVRDKLRNPSSNPQPQLQELYAIVAAPFADELAALEKAVPSTQVPTLLWSLDGAMRYLPMSALWDGKRYMVERFNNVLFTPESYAHMADTDTGPLRVLAMGLSKSYGGLPALPGVLPELDAVAHDPSIPESHGPLDGVLLPNDRFTYAALKEHLAEGAAFPVVHIASHFVLEANGGAEPYLMLGGDSAGDAQGFQLTLSRLEDSTVNFHGTRLLTLSACSTAKGDTAQNGLEMDSLGMIAQQKDAQAVLATLWDVSDASTSQLMSDFYARWVKDAAEGKAEALRQAQLDLLHGKAGSGSNAAARGFQAETQATQASQGYSHPYYWAPFVLIGNYR